MDKTEDGVQKRGINEILLEELGQFGKYQLRVLLLSAIAVIWAGIAASDFVFTTARINTRCLIPECETSPLDFSPDWLANAIPSTDGSFDQCSRFNASTPMLRTCPADIFDRNNVVPCEEYVYEHQNTVVYDFGLACQEWLRSLIGSVHIFGTLTAMPIAGFVSDRWGRSPALAAAAFIRGCFGLVRSWTNTYVGFTILHFLQANFGFGAFSCAYILIMEMMGPKYRVACGATLDMFFAIGKISAGLIAWGVPHWRWFHRAIYGPMLLAVVYFWLMPESIRWYMSKGRFEESEAVLEKAVRVNGKTLSDQTRMELRKSAEEEKKNNEFAAAQKTSEPWLVVQVFQHKSILLRCMVSPVWWITTTFIYYGLAVNAVIMSGNMYLNYVAVAAMEIPGYWTAVLVLNRIGRKPVLVGGFWLCAACQLAYIFIPDGYDGFSLAVYLIGNYCIAIVMTTLYVYTSELFPTKHRHSLFAFAFMLGRLGSILSPLTPAMGASSGWAELPFALFGGFALLSGGLAFITPETLGSKLPDTMEEAANIGKK
ncbi:organic cation transporter protein-like [Leguminivora glycinivorella]|uniref:organic cation transporter protein-like n=1 Tax=Leguminivora glycinivorella TaxID=1035111 RepID=UPI00200FBD10|nr:organic cation transporter protein-like [Leguminivora glycinivorella]